MGEGAFASKLAAVVILGSKVHPMGSEYGFLNLNPGKAVMAPLSTCTPNRRP